MKKDWYSYLTPEFKLDRRTYRVNDRYSFDCPQCGDATVVRLNHVKRKIKDIGFYECSKCRKQASAERARAKFKDKHEDKNPYELESVKKKIKQTNLKRYGVDCMLKLPEVHLLGIKKASNIKFNNRKSKIDFSQITVSSKNRTEWMRQYNKLRMKYDPEYCAQKKVYNAIGRMLKGSKRSKTSILKKLGYTSQELRSYIESLFHPGMTWENYGEWHLDHIKPLSSFDCTKESEIIKANQLENLQPLWAKDNLKKSNKH